MIYVGGINYTASEKFRNLITVLNRRPKLKRAGIEFPVDDELVGATSCVSLNGLFQVSIIGLSVTLKYFGQRHRDIRRASSTYRIVDGYIGETLVNRMLTIYGIVSYQGNQASVSPAIPVVIDDIEETHYKDIVARRAKYEESEAERANIFLALKSKLSELPIGKIESEVTNEYVNFVTQDGLKFKIYADPMGVIVKNVELPNRIIDPNSLTTNSLLPKVPDVPIF